MTATDKRLVYKVWHAGGRSFRWEVRYAGASGNPISTGCGASSDEAAAAAMAVIVAEQNKAAAEWRDA